nr:MAG TPA: hypothetical protein [Caudoviricetes sp.]
MWVVGNHLEALLRVRICQLLLGNPTRFQIW